MLPHKLSFPRTLSSNRPLRPPNIINQKHRPRPRLFTRNSQLLLIPPPPPRPQLPFLHSPSGAHRLLTTERKRYIKDEFIKVVKIICYGYVFYGLFKVICFGIQTELWERKYPTPPEWGMWIRIMYRSARAAEDPSEGVEGHIDYARAGGLYLEVLEFVEQGDAGVVPVLKADGDIDVAEVGKAGLDISSKSEPWCRGYHEALMGAARAAEDLEGCMLDRRRLIVFPSNMVVGPSNPRPKPVPADDVAAPLEKDCVPAYASPESFYTKLLTTQGFSPRQRLQAALSYADWLNFKGLPEKAEAMYAWGLDIAVGALPLEAQNVVNKESGIISADANYISSNLLLATTSLAIHHARNKNFAAALPIFLSVLRATRQLPFPSQKPRQYSIESNSADDSGLWSNIKHLVNSPPYPAAPPTGDEPQLRTPLAVCQEAGVMAHIGEVIFAAASSATNPPSTSSKSKNKMSSEQNLNAGINWTRDALEVAEATFLGTDRQDREARKKCAECVKVGVDNWEKMVTKMIMNATLQGEQQNSPSKRADSSPSPNTATPENGGAGWANWLPTRWSSSFSHHGGGISAERKVDAETYERWQREAELVHEKRIKLLSMLRMDGLSDEDGPGPGSAQEWGLLFR